jgi:hypothetical protein
MPASASSLSRPSTKRSASARSVAPLRVESPLAEDLRIGCEQLGG